MIPACIARYKNFIIIMAILCLAFALRVYHLDKYTLWYDEAISALDRGLDRIHSPDKLLDQSFLIKRHDYLFLYNHGVVYYWQMLFGKSEFALRFSSVIFSLLSIYVLFMLGQEIFDVRAARLAGFFLAVSSFHIYYAQELRPYAAASFFTLAALYAFLKILKSGKNRYWWSYTAANILNVYFLYVTLLALFVFIIFFISNIRKYRGMLRVFVAHHILIFTALSPVFLSLYPNLVFFFTHHLDPERSELPVWAGEKIGFEHVIFTLKNFAAGYNVDYYSILGKIATGTYFMLFLTSMIKFYKRAETKLLLSCLAIPILTLFFISKIKSCYVDRYFFGVFPIYILIVSAGLINMQRPLSRILIALVLALNICSFIKYQENDLPQREASLGNAGVVQRQNIGGAAQFISNNFQKGDFVLYTCKNIVFPLKFYARKLNVAPELINEIDRGTVYFFSGSGKGKEFLTVDYSGSYPFTFIPEQYQVTPSLEKANRIWLVFSGWDFRGTASSEYLVVKKMMEHSQIMKMQRFHSVFIYLLVKNNG